MPLILTDMPAGILSDMIQQYKAIFEGEPIELGPGEAQAVPAQTSLEQPQAEKTLSLADAPQPTELNKRGNRNSMIYATNSDVLLNSVGRELTGECDSI